MTKEYKGFLDEAIKLGADGKSVQVTITNKETYKIKDNYISVGAELMFEFGLPKDGDVDAIGVALDAYTRAAVEHSIRDQKAAKGIIAIETQVNAQQAATVAETPPPAAPEIAAMPPAATSTPISADPTHIVLKNPHIARTDEGRAKIFGKTEEYNWTRWGVHIWHEVLDAAVEGAPTLANWRDWPLCKGTSTGFPDGEGSNRYALPDGLQEAVVLMKQEEGKWKPDKVTELR